MINYTPHEILLQIGFIKIFSWGFFAALGFLITSYLFLRAAKKQGYKEDQLIELLTYTIIGIILGSRLFFVFSNYLYFLAYPLKILAVWEGGMTSYGGIIGGTLAFYLACRKNKLKFLKMADIYSPYVALGLAIGRIGCFARFCCYGIKTAVPWAVNVGEGFGRHPTQLYEMLTDFFSYLALRKLRTTHFSKKHDGTTFFSMILFYSIFRFIIDFFRDYDTSTGLITSRILTVVFIIISATFLIKKYASKK